MYSAISFLILLKDSLPASATSVYCITFKTCHLESKRALERLLGSKESLFQGPNVAAARYKAHS